jgi:hypothetical protein
MHRLNSPITMSRVGSPHRIRPCEPDAFALLYSAPSVAAYTSVIHEGVAVLQGLVARIAEAGRLRVVVHATVLIHAAGTGVTLTLAATPPEERDPRLSDTMREAILTAVTVPASAKARKGGRDAAPAAERVAVHAVALRALLTEAANVLSPEERQLLCDWLDQLATARSPRAPMRRSPPASPADAQRPSLEVVERRVPQALPRFSIPGGKTGDRRNVSQFSKNGSPRLSIFSAPDDYWVNDPEG